MIKVGIDVGGTNTDAVVMDDRRILHSCKTATTGDVMSGVMNALREVCGGAAMPFDAVDAVMIGTTHFTNALIERKGLNPVAAIRLGAPATTGLPPLTDWPEDFIRAANIRTYITAGGYEFDGRVLAELDVPGLQRIAEVVAGAGVRDIAISSVFAFLNADQEQRAAEVIRKIVPDARITLSSSVGRIGLLERENATILNACLGDLAESVVGAFEAALSESGIVAPFYLTQNDGTLLNSDQARRFPVLTVASGPTNSMRGAAFLSGLKSAIVVDIGGTTSDVGVLSGGFPRQSGVAVSVAGVRTNFRMPDVHSIGLGGGSIVSEDFASIGPRSVGYRIRSEAMVYDGHTVTATDIAVAAGVARLGEPERVSMLDRDLVSACYGAMQKMLFHAIERMRTSPEPLPIIVVGGGSILVGNSLDGMPVMVPPEFGVANAVGAAMAQVSGEVSRVVVLDGVTRDEAIAQAREEATALAVAAGADGGTISVLDIEETPLAYLPGNATRIHLRVVGDLL
jgi:N-methylhydantoinase A/oxoprolinase/acetone carboxylase beta subunit